MKKFYAVKNGRNIGIFGTWEECKAQVDGFSGAEFKSFTKQAEALAYIKGEKKEFSENFAYVDGSFLAETMEFSFGAVISLNGKESEFSAKFSNPELAAMHNVAGEIKGAEFVMKYCVSEGINEIDLYFDYNGIEKWCTGEWKANKEGTAAYRDFYLSIKDKLKVNFKKVKGHSGDKLNERVDRLAKQALGIE